MIMCMDGVGTECERSVYQFKGSFEISRCKCQRDSSMRQSSSILALERLNGARVQKRTLAVIAG
jgi:hypothetical protein